MKNVDDICIRNMPLVPYVIKMMGLSDKYEDYVDIGWIGLVIGCKKYDEKLGFNESTYLTHYIKYFIYNQLKYERNHRADINQEILSLDYAINDDSFIDFMPSNFSIDEEFNKVIIDQAINDCLEYDMSDKKTKISHAAVIRDLYGIKAKPMKINDICKKYNISHTTIHDIRNKFRKKLKKRLLLILD